MYSDLQVNLFLVLQSTEQDGSHNNLLLNTQTTASGASWNINALVNCSEFIYSFFRMPHQNSKQWAAVGHCLLMSKQPVTCPFWYSLYDLLSSNSFETSVSFFFYKSMDKVHIKNKEKIDFVISKAKAFSCCRPWEKGLPSLYYHTLS